MPVRIRTDQVGDVELSRRRKIALTVTPFEMIYSWAKSQDTNDPVETPLKHIEEEDPQVKTSYQYVLDLRDM